MIVQRSLVKNRLLPLGLGLLFLTSSPHTFAHGIMESPAARNQFCGELTKPDDALNGVGTYPACKEAFKDDPTNGYNYMSVLTHAEGRKVVRPLPENICGFNAETWAGKSTPWDKAIDWPTNNMQAGINEIVWNISWGSHFNDTKEFSYWITKPDFVFQVGVPLSWNDFEEAPFCDLKYDDTAPNANPNIQPDKDNARFHTFCNVPAREGRHVIYGEWGRNHYTFERFHGCIDTVFSDIAVNTVDAVINATPAVEGIKGAGSITFSGQNSEGEGLSYQWTVTGGETSHYSFSDATSSTPVFSYLEPSAAANISIRLTVTDGVNSDTSTLAFEHIPSLLAATWIRDKPLTANARVLNQGDMVTVRVVDSNGIDKYLPSPALKIDSTNSAADVWPYQLATLIGNNGDIAVGVLNTNTQVTPAFSATDNNIYTRIGADVTGVFLTVDSPVQKSNCEFILANEWNTGYVAGIRITNNGSTAINGWEVSWTLETSRVGDLWNANFTSGTPNVASNLSWNANIAPGQSFEFGYNGKKNNSNTPMEIPIVSGTVCH